MKDQLKLIRDNQGIEELTSYLADKDLVIVDTETNGLTEEALIIGYSICAEPGLAFYVITHEWDKEKQDLIPLETHKSSPEFFSTLTGKKLVGHNFVFDAAMISRNYKVDLIDDCYCDTMVLSHLVDENRPKGLKDLGTLFYGPTAKAEQEAMEASVIANGGLLTKGQHEMFKADSDKLGTYGAKDAILTFNLFYELMEQLFAEQELVDFFFQESMPLLRGPTYQLNTTGLKVDVAKLNDLKSHLEAELIERQSFILKEIQEHICDLYPGGSAKNTFNIGSGQQLAWLLFERLQNVPGRVTDAGKELCEAFYLKVPYTNRAKREFIEKLKEFKGAKVGGRTVRDHWWYFSTDEEALTLYADKYKWVEELLKYKKTYKILNTYVEGIAERVRYGVIRPSFLQTGTDGTRYSSRDPNFQNLPRKDNRIKKCIVSRPGKVFVGADYSQLEPRVFAYLSKDEALMGSFQKGQDFYSVVGTKVYNKSECSVYKKDPNFFGTMYPDLRDKTKIFALSIVYGKNVRDIASELGISVEEAQIVRDNYLAQFPRIELMMLEAHNNIKKLGYAKNIFGRKRHVPEALEINQMYPNAEHKDLQYKERTLLNLGVNYPIQATAGSIVNRSSIKMVEKFKNAGIDARLVLQVHDSLCVECKEEDSAAVSAILQDCMENTVVLEGVPLVAEPQVSRDLAGLK
jgi:DNA polymerase-1